MKNFEFYNPTRIVFGQGMTERVGKETLPYGKKVMLLYGRGSVKQNGILTKVQHALTQTGITAVEQGGVRSNPVLNDVYSAIAQYQQNQCEAIVAVGGGSVIDTAKAVAAGVYYNGDVWDFFCGKAKVGKAVPIITVLTLAATASEMNNGGVITNEKTQQKYNLMGQSLFPKVSILDPVNTFTVPQNHSMYGAVDAIIHLMEGYFNAADINLPLQQRMVEGLIKTIMESAEVIYSVPDDYTARANMMWAASLALNGLTTAGTGNQGFPMHMIEHALSALYDISHGAGLAIVAPAWMKYVYQQDIARFSRFAEQVFGIGEGTDHQKALAGITALESWFRKIEVPVRLSQINITEEAIEMIAGNARGLAELWGMKQYTTDVISSILKMA